MKLRVTTRLANVRRGFSLVEVLVSLAILGFAASALLLATESASQASQDALSETVAQGIAEQVLDELLSRRYVEVGQAATVWPLGAESGESATPVKTKQFDDTDDFHGMVVTPPRDPWGSVLGQGNGSGGTRASDFQIPTDWLAKWRVTCNVTYVNESNPAVDLTGSSTSAMRAATVKVDRWIDGAWQTMTTQRRVFAYVAPTNE